MIYLFFINSFKILIDGYFKIKILELLKKTRKIIFD